MNGERIYNFAAGPAQIPLPVLQQAQSELLNWHGTGMSVMEMSHRSAAFQKISSHAESTFRMLMNIPQEYDVLFLQGGASSQFSMVPLNLIGNAKKAEYAVTGHFSASAAAEAGKYGAIHIVCDGKDSGYSRIPLQQELSLVPDAAYFHYCENNTIYGTAWPYVPDTGGIPLVADMSSSLTSHPVDFSKYVLVYAGAQKNMAPAGLTVVIIKHSAAGHELPFTPVMMNYQKMIEKHSMYNTPPCWQIYMFGLEMDWLLETGGVREAEKRNREKASLLYGTLEECSLFRLHAEKNSRSCMNVTFRTGSAELDRKFAEEAVGMGLDGLKGHRLTGGMRASIYNAMPLDGVKKLCAFIESFDRRNRR